MYLNLESLWADYVRSVDRFVEMLDGDNARREVALKRWRELSWSVQMFDFEPNALRPQSYGASAMAPASYGTSATQLKR